MRAVRASGATNFSSLTAHHPLDLLEQPNVGETTVREIREKLHALVLYTVAVPGPPLRC